MTCKEPHDLERMGGAGDDEWFRCRRCGEWLWTCNDTSSRYQFQGSWPLDRARAEQAFVEGSLVEALQLVVDEKLPQGPNTTSEPALMSLLEALAPRASDDERMQALRAARLDDRWRRVLSLLERRLAAAKATGGPLLDFAQDLAFDGVGIDEVYELTCSLAGLRTGPRPELVRVDMSGVVTSTVLPAAPRFLGHTEACVVFSVATAAGHQVMAIDDGGRVIGWPPSPVPAYALSLDDGHWLLFTREAVATGQLFDASWQLLFTYRFALGSGWYPAPPRRFAGGWIASAVMDKAGGDHALTWMIPQQGVKAVSPDGTGGRLVEPLSSTTLLAETLSAPFTLETWQLDGERLVRQTAHPVHRWRRMRDAAVILLGKGSSPRLSLRRLGLDGSVVWEQEVARSPGAYLADAPGSVLLYDDQSARLFALQDGRELDGFDVLGSVHVLGGEREALYVLSGDELRIVTSDGVRVIAVPSTDIATTCGGGVLLRLREGSRYRLIGPDGQTRGDIEAPRARFSVIGTRAGPYVLEPGRLRVAKWPGQLW